MNTPTFNPVPAGSLASPSSKSCIMTSLALTPTFSNFCMTQLSPFDLGRPALESPSPAPEIPEFCLKSSPCPRRSPPSRRSIFPACAPTEAEQCSAWRDNCPAPPILVLRPPPESPFARPRAVPSLSLVRTHASPRVSSCGCKHSRCAKLYCECCRQHVSCGTRCDCKLCRNKTDRGRKRKAERQFEKENKRSGKRSRPEPYRSGCTCKKSHCLKGYCECYQRGKVCGWACRCRDCQNAVRDLTCKEVLDMDRIVLGLEVTRAAPGGGCKRQLRLNAQLGGLNSIKLLVA